MTSHQLNPVLIFNTELTARCLCWHTRLWSLNTSVPRYLSQRINRRVNARTLRSTATQLLIQPFARTDFAKRSFRCAAPSVWNSLPVSVIGCDSLSVFKSRLKPFLFRKSYNYHVHNRLPFRPYGAIQICLSLLLLLSRCYDCSQHTHMLRARLRV